MRMKNIIYISRKPFSYFSQLQSPLFTERESLRSGVCGELVLAVLSNFAPFQTLRPILRPAGTEHDIA